MSPDSPLIVVDADLSDEKLSELIARRAEYPELDYKRKIDLEVKRDLLELTKDVGAMQVRGGYILIGVDDDGSISGDMDDIELRPFDEASLASKLDRYLTGPLKLAARVTRRDGHTIVAICVSPHPSGCSFFKINGGYEDRNGKPITVFHAGDAYCRVGTKSARLTQSGWEEVVSGRIAAAKREWMAEQARIRGAEIAELQAASRSSDLASAPLGSVNLDMDLLISVSPAWNSSAKAIESGSNTSLKTRCGEAACSSATRTWRASAISSTRSRASPPTSSPTTSRPGSAR